MSTRMWIRLLLIGALLLAAAWGMGCASAGGPRRVAVISAISAHSTLAAIQDTEALLVCGAPTAPPQCISPEAHQAFARQLVIAFDLDASILNQVRLWPPDSPVPANIAHALDQLREYVVKLIALLPNSPQKEKLVYIVAGGGQ